MSELTAADEVLFRQIHPEFIEGEYPTSQAFAPTPKDYGKLSVDRSSITNAKASHELYTRTGLSSVAVFGVSVAEFRSQGLTCHGDPITECDRMPGNPAHAFGDFNPFGTNQQKNKAKRLKLVAIARGQLHPAVKARPAASATS